MKHRRAYTEITEEHKKVVWGIIEELEENIEQSVGKSISNIKYDTKVGSLAITYGIGRVHTMQTFDFYRLHFSNLLQDKVSKIFSFTEQGNTVEARFMKIDDENLRLECILTISRLGTECRWEMEITNRNGNAVAQIVSLCRLTKVKEWKALQDLLNY